MFEVVFLTLGPAQGKSEESKPLSLDTVLPQLQPNGLPYRFRVCGDGWNAGEISSRHGRERSFDTRSLEHILQVRRHIVLAI
jgi:hypothetical protein